jgi:hypothetical protein
MSQHLPEPGTGAQPSYPPVQPVSPTPQPPADPALPRWALAVAGAAAFVALIAAFLPWASVRLSVLGAASVIASVDGTSSPMLGWLSLLLAIAAGVVVALLVVRPAPNLWLALPGAGLLIAVAALISLSRLQNAIPTASAGSGTGVVPRGGAFPDAGTLPQLGVTPGAPLFSGSVSSGTGLWLTLASGLALVAAPLAARALVARGRATA